MAFNQMTNASYWEYLLVYVVQPKKEHECSMASESNLDDGIKTHCIYAAIVDAGQI
jgi:hypothetical protein